MERLKHRYGVHGIIKWIKQVHGNPSPEELESARERPLWILVHSSRFRWLYSTIVIMNVVFVGVLTEVELWNAAAREPPNKWWSNGEAFFCCVFLAEIVLRLLAERRLFFNGPSWKWNMFDMLVLVASFTEVAFDLNSSTSPLQGIVIARVLRFTRILRVMSVVRVMRNWRSLRLVVLTLFESLLSMVSCLLVLAAIIFVFAVFLVQGVTSQLNWQDAAGADGAQQLELRTALLELYGGIPSAAICLFMMVSGGLDWKDAMIPMKEVYPTYEYVITFYVFFMVIVVLNVVIGAFVATTGDIAARDRDLVAQSQMNQLTDYFKKVKTFFSEADLDGSGKLSFDEFKAHLKHKLVKAYFHALGIDVSQAELLFHLLDKDGSHMVTLDEFIAGCIRLRGHAKSLDVNLLLHETRQVSKRVKQLRDVLLQMGVPDSSHIMP